MRAPAILLALAASPFLGGCVEDGPGPEFSTCPQWTVPSFTRDDGSPGEQTLLIATHVFFFNRTSHHIGPHSDGGPVEGSDGYDPYAQGLGAGRLEFRGHPLDAVRVDVDLGSPGNGLVDAVLEAYVTAADGAQVPWHAIGPRAGEATQALRFEPGAANRTAFVSLAPPTEEADPRPLRVDWYFFPDADGDGETASAARFTASYVPMYRTWDGPCLE